MKNSRLGFWVAILTSIVTLVFAVSGIATPARSGPFCRADCVAHPYVDVAQYVPADYLWLVPGLFLAPLFVVLMVCIQGYAAAENRKVFSQISQLFSMAYAAIIMVDYFVQLAVVAPSLRLGEVEALSLFTQYNPHGFFIALEALGYSMMSIALLFVAPVFAGKGVERIIRWLLMAGFVTAVVAFAGLWVRGHDLVAFEVAILSINWLVLIPAGLLLSRVFRQNGRSHPS